MRRFVVPSTSHRRCLFLCLLLLELLLPAPVHATVTNSRLGEPNATSCWTYEDPPRCDVPSDFAFDFENTTVETVCGILDYLYIWNYEVLWELELHVNALAELQQDDEMCAPARQAYHLCAWCMPKSDPDYGREDFCYLEGDICVPPNDTSLTINGDSILSLVQNNETAMSLMINQTCEELEYVFYDVEWWPATLDLCRRAEALVYACDFYCRDGQRNPQFYGGEPNETSCWTYEDPPNCSNIVDSLDDLEQDDDFDLQTVCEDLFYDYMLDDYYVATLETHLYQFASIQAGTPECDAARWAYPYCRFCHPLQKDDPYWCDHQGFCKDAGHRKPVVKDPNVNMRLACEELKPIMTAEIMPATADLCYKAETSLHACDYWCAAPYLGADTKPKKWTLVGLARLSAILSLGGALYIIQHVLSSATEPTRSRSVTRRSVTLPRTVYHQMLLAMAVFDVVTAVAWCFSTAPLPLDEAWNIVGVVGNRATCTAQAFFIQLGFTSVFYNTSLALYYVLVIVYRWREGDLKKIRMLLHGGPLLFGLALAGAVVPYADWTGYGCHIVPPPDGDFRKSIVFVILPVGVSVLCITCSMAFMYWNVWQKARAARRWSLASTTTSLKTRVFWQALLYTLSFYVTWPIMFAVYWKSVDTEADNFALTATVSFVAPLQGFSNFLVYIRPQLMAESSNRSSSILQSFRSFRSFYFRRSSGSHHNHSESSVKIEFVADPSETPQSVVQEEEDPAEWEGVDPSVLIAMPQVRETLERQMQQQQETTDANHHQSQSEPTDQQNGSCGPTSNPVSSSSS